METFKSDSDVLNFHGSLRFATGLSVSFMADTLRLSVEPRLGLHPTLAASHPRTMVSLHKPLNAICSPLKSSAILTL